MTKSKLHKKKLLPLCIVLTLVILGIFNLNSVSAISWPGDGAKFIPDDDWPSQYGVFIPQPNMYTTLSIDASNQGEYTIMDQVGAPLDTELVDYPGADISELYPWYFDTYWEDTTTNSNLIFPWAIDWINITTLNPHDITLSNYTVNSVFNYHVMSEWSTLNIPLNSSIPMQIDLMIDSVGPKVLKLDWFNEDNPWGYDPLGANWAIISPSGKVIAAYKDQARFYDVLGFLYDRELFDYITFVAHEKGAYRLLMRASDDDPTHLSLDFLDTPTSTLASDSLEFFGNADESPSLVEVLDTEWQNNWYKIDGEKGDLYRLDIGIDYEGDYYPVITSWMPCDNGYVANGLMGADVYDLYFPTTGTAYLSFIDADHGDAYRFSLYLEEFEISNYTIGYDLYTTKLSRDQRKAIEFEVEQDSFVRFNYTLFEQPAGNPMIYAEITNFGFIYEDSNDIECYDIISPIEIKPVGTETFYYYYMPAGNYKGLLRNDDVRYEGVVQIDSKYVDYTNTTIPITSLTYPDMYPTNWLTVNFEPDDYYNGIHASKVVDIEIPDLGWYVLNTTIYASDHLAGLPLEADPLKVVTYNSSADTYIDVTELALDPLKNFSAFSTDNPSATLGDRVYIAYTSKWHDMHFNFSTPGIGGNDLDAWYWNGAGWDYDYITSDNPASGTQDFNQNGTIILDDFGTSDFNGWTLGAGFDLPDIDEDLYFWLGIEHDTLDGSPYSQLPYIQTIKLSNITIEGDINLKLVMDSGYNYSDYYVVNPGLIGPELLINQEVAHLNDSGTTMLIGPNWIEPGTYKLLITPHEFGYLGSLSIDFGVIDYWPYAHTQSYNITEEPNLYPYRIKSYNRTWYGPNNITTYSYGLTTTYNHTEVVAPGYTNSYFLLECYGDPYAWTQLVASTNNVSAYNLYFLEDLPWFMNMPTEFGVIATPVPSLNTTIEFGVHLDHFYLLFEVTPDGINELITFRIDLNQYDTTILTTSVPIGSYTPPPSPGLPGGLVLGLAIGIPVAAGVIVLIYVLKKKGRIGSKTP